MKVRFWGTRGSFAMSGPEYLRYGGNTPAVEVMADSGDRLLVDLGTGATELAKVLMACDFGQGKGHLPVLLSHTHLDHIQGLPFFTPFFIKGNQIRILGNQPTGMSLKEVLQNQLNPHYSPLYGLENLAAGVTIESMPSGSTLHIDGFEVTAVALPHCDMWPLAFRITADDKTVVYISDVEYPDNKPTVEALSLTQGADLLIHDAMYTDEQHLGAGCGHSPVSSAVALAEQAGVGQLVLFHYHPDATDDDIDAMADWVRQQTEIPVLAAAEGSELA